VGGRKEWEKGDSVGWQRIGQGGGAIREITVELIVRKSLALRNIKAEIQTE
jgi:hypothetical protein